MWGLVRGQKSKDQPNNEVVPPQEEAEEEPVYQEEEQEFPTYEEEENVIEEEETVADVPPGMHVVKPAETLYSISKQHGLTLLQIMEYNKMTSAAVSNGDTLYLVPHGKASSVEEVKKRNDDAVSVAPVLQTETRKGDYNFHTVAPGETLYGIGRQVQH